MLPSPAELRELAERIKAAVSKAQTDEMKQQLAGHAFRLAQVAEQLDRDVGVDAYVAQGNAARYEHLLRQALDEHMRRTVEKLLAENTADLEKQRSQIRAWRQRAAELRATADRFTVPPAQESLHRAATNFDTMADHVEALLGRKPKGMLPSPTEMRELSERIRAAVPKARTGEIKRLLARHAFRLAQVAEQLESIEVTTDALVRRSHIERYERLLSDALDERTRRTVEALLAQENTARDKEWRQISAWRKRAAELRATADRFTVPSAQEALRRAATNIETMADHAEGLLTGKQKAPGEEAG